MQRIYLHVGLPKSGTTHLQGVLARSRDALRSAGYVYPFVRPEAMFHAAVELRGQHALWGLRPEDVDGTWDLLVGRAREVGGTAVLSHEILAGASPAVVRRVLGSLEGFEVHLVVTARDLARQVTAHWQEEVKNGRPWRFSDLEAALFTPAESTAEELGFWRSQDLLDVVARWGSTLPPDRVHLVTVPPAGAPRDLLWQRFAEAVGLDPAVVGPLPDAEANDSLGAGQVAFLREVVEALDGRLAQPAYAHVVKRRFAQGLLAARPSPRATTPPALAARLAEVARTWQQEVRRAGWAVHGDLDDLVSHMQPEPEGHRHPDDVPAEERLAGVPEAVAALLLEVADLRARVARLEGGGPGTDAAQAEEAAGEPRRSRDPWRLLRERRHK